VFFPARNLVKIAGPFFHSNRAKQKSEKLSVPQNLTYVKNGTQMRLMKRIYAGFIPACGQAGVNIQNISVIWVPNKVSI
jgi:hypothetical protein